MAKEKHANVQANYESFEAILAKNKGAYDRP